MPVIPEILANVVVEKDSTQVGTILFVARESFIKRKWSELVAVGMQPDSNYHYVPKYVSPNYTYNVVYTYIKMYYPDISSDTKYYGGVGIDVLEVSPLQLSFINYVVLGNMNYNVFKAMKESWSSSLLTSYRSYEDAGNIEGFYDNVLVNVSGLRSGLGKDDRGDANILDAWLWGPGDLTIGFATRISGFEAADYDTLEPKIDVVNIDNINGDISEETKNEIKDSSKEFKPRRNKGIKRQNIYKNKKKDKDKKAVEEEEEL